MRAREQETVLRLRLSIDQRGRVVAVEPVGRADPTFLAAARRHILRAWRYKPAMEGDKAVAATTVVTLKFELDCRALPAGVAATPPAPYLCRLCRSSLPSPSRASPGAT
jgi:hypothetical protein